MTVTPESFRGDFPEFSNPATYPSSQINLYLSLAVIQVSETRWGGYADYGTELFIAHHLAMEQAEAKAVARGGSPGARIGAIASEGVGPANVVYDVAGVTLKNAGDWGKTLYGIRFLRMRRELGVGGLQV